MTVILRELVGICLLEVIIGLVMPQGSIKKPLQTVSGVILLCLTAKLILSILSGRLQ